MKVRATQMVYYGHKRRRVGEVFHIKSEKEFSKESMEKVGKGKKADPTPEPEPEVEVEEPTTEEPAEEPAPEQVI